MQQSHNEVICEAIFKKDCLVKIYTISGWSSIDYVHIKPDINFPGIVYDISSTGQIYIPYSAIDHLEIKYLKPPKGEHELLLVPSKDL